MAWNGTQEVVSNNAATDFSTRQYHIVEISSGAFNVDLAAANKGYGVLQNHPKTGEAATICIGGETKVRAGATIAYGDFVTSAATGYATPVGSAAATARVLGRARSAAASGSVFTIDIDRYAVSSGMALG